MRKLILSAIAVAALTAQALAQTYPVSGNWGPAIAGKKGPIDCNGRIVGFSGNQRTDTGSSVPNYRLKTLTTDGPAYRVTDIFTNGMIHGGTVSYTLQQTDQDHLTMKLQPGGTLNLQRCK